MEQRPDGGGDEGRAGNAEPRPRQGGEQLAAEDDLLRQGRADGDRREDEQEQQRLVGDVEFDTAVLRAGAITPVPGGVGPMTIAMLMRNTLTAAERSMRR